MLFRSNLVLVLLDEGRNEEALELAHWVLDAKRRLFGEEDVQVAMALGNVGLARAALGQHAEALAPLRESLSLWERAVGPDNPTLWHALSGLARSALAVGEADEARIATARALALLEAQGTPPSPDLLFTHADATWAAGDRSSAIATMQRVADMLPPDAPRASGRVHRDQATEWLAAHRI